MITIRISFNDLSEEMKKKIIAVFGDNNNWDAIPMSVMEINDPRDIVLDSFLGDENVPEIQADVPEGTVEISHENGTKETAEIYRHGSNDYSVFFPESDCSVRGTLEDVYRELAVAEKTPERIARLFALAQWSGSDDPLVSFEHEGQNITDPWIDPSGRFPYTTDKAKEVYGKENVEKFIEDVCKFLNDIEK